MGYTDNEKSAAKMVIRFFNMQAGTSYRSGGEDNWGSNINYTLRALERANSISELKDHIRDYANGGGKNIIECMDSFRSVTAEAPAQQEVPQVAQSVDSAFDLLGKVVVDMLAKTKSDEIESEIMGRVEQKVRDFIKEEYGTIERKIITVVDEKRVPMHGIQHEKFDQVLKFVANDEPVFLTGPAGSGKNVLCKQVAEALELPFYFTNCVTQEYQLKGFTDAMGHYQETQFYKAFKDGGVFMLDEMDASIPDVLNILNAAIANRYFDFPAPIGFVEASPNFRVIAAGNTTGQGASNEYVGRNQLDAASLDRFAIIKIDYSDAIEQNVAQGNMELLTFCREFRKAAQKTGQQVIISYRGIGRLAKMVNLLTLDEAIETCITKGMEADDIGMIASEITTDNEYKRALRRLAART